MVENLAIGAKCMLYYCQLKDFLPYKCSKCAGTYCQQHLHSHECTASNLNDKLGFLCPVCNTTVVYNGMQNADDVFNEHTLSGDCEARMQAAQQKPQVYTFKHFMTDISPSEPPLEEVKKPVKPAKPKCPVCKETITEINKFVCPRCREWTCLKHRAQEAHKCTGRPL